MGQGQKAILARSGFGSKRCAYGEGVEGSSATRERCCSTYLQRGVNAAFNQCRRLNELAAWKDVAGCSAHVATPHLAFGADAEPLVVCLGGKLCAQSALLRLARPTIPGACYTTNLCYTCIQAFGSISWSATSCMEVWGEEEMEGMEAVYAEEEKEDTWCCWGLVAGVAGGHSATPSPAEVLHSNGGATVAARDAVAYATVSHPPSLDKCIFYINATKL